MTLSYEIEHFNPYSPRVQNLTPYVLPQPEGSFAQLVGKTTLYAFGRIEPLDGEKAVLSRSTSRAQNFLRLLSSTLRGSKT
jgi:hypothetical protein